MRLRAKKTIRIFLASSAELSEDRIAFADLIVRLNQHYEKRGIELILHHWGYLDQGFHSRRMQDEYNDFLRHCDVFICLFFTKAGLYTIEEFEVALEENRTRQLPLLIFMKELECDQQEHESLTKFKERINELGFFWRIYGSIEKLHLDFVMWLDSFLLEGNSVFKVEEGAVTIDGTHIVRMSGLPFAANNEDYQRMSQEIQNYPEKIERLRLLAEKYSEDHDLQDELQQALDDYNTLIKEFTRYQQSLLDTAKFIAENRPEQTSHKLQSAIDAFEIGDLKLANVLLKEISIEAETHIEQLEHDRELLHQYIDAFLLNVQTEMANVNTPIEERIANAIKLYAKADDWANRSTYDKGKYANLLFDYASFLIDFAFYKDAEQVSLRQNILSEEFYGKDSPTTADSLNNTGLVYYYMGDDEKALEYYRMALDIRKRALRHNHIDIAASYSVMGELFFIQGKYDDALKYYKNALRIRKRKMNKHNFLISTSYSDIGSALESKKEYSKAIENYRKALKIREKRLGRNPITATSLYSIGTVLLYQGYYKKTLVYYHKALEISEKFLGDNHPYTLLIRESIEYAQQKMHQGWQIEPKGKTLKDRFLSLQHFINKKGDISST